MNTPSAPGPAPAPAPGPKPDSQPDGIVPTDNGLPMESGHARMPWFLLAVWIVAILFYIWYLARFAVPDLKDWLAR